MRAKGLTDVLGGPRGGSWPRCESSPWRRSDLATKTVCVLSLRVTRVLSSVLARQRGCIFRQGGPCASKHRIFFRSIQRHRFGWCLRNKWLDQIKRCEFRTWIALVHRASARVKTRQMLIAFRGKDKDLSPIDRKRNTIQESEWFRTRKIFTCFK